MYFLNKFLSSSLGAEGAVGEMGFCPSAVPGDSLVATLVCKRSSSLGAGTSKEGAGMDAGYGVGRGSTCRKLIQPPHYYMYISYHNGLLYATPQYILCKT